MIDKIQANTYHAYDIWNRRSIKQYLTNWYTSLMIASIVYSRYHKTYTDDMALRFVLITYVRNPGISIIVASLSQCQWSDPISWNYYLLFRVRSWNNVMRCMFFLYSSGYDMRKVATHEKQTTVNQTFSLLCSNTQSVHRICMKIVIVCTQIIDSNENEYLNSAEHIFWNWNIKRVSVSILNLYKYIIYDIYITS